MNPARKNEDVIRYNAIAGKIMQEEGILINDLYQAAVDASKRVASRRTRRNAKSRLVGVRCHVLVKRRPLPALLVIGVFFVFSATTVAESNTQLAWHKQAWVRQIIWYTLGIAGMVAMSSIDYRLLARWSFVGYVGIILLLVIAAAVFGLLWFLIDFVAGQFPSEGGAVFAKIAKIAKSRRQFRVQHSSFRAPTLAFLAILARVLPGLREFIRTSGRSSPARRSRPASSPCRP